MSSWEAQEVPTEELSQEELDKLVADEVESLREKKKALEGMLTSQGLGASDQVTNSVTDVLLLEFVQRIDVP